MEHSYCNIRKSENLWALGDREWLKTLMAYLSITLESNQIYSVIISTNLRNFFGLSGNELNIYAARVIMIAKWFPPEFCLVMQKIWEVGTRVKSNFDTDQNFLQIFFSRDLENLNSFKFNITQSIKLWTFWGQIWNI